MNANGEKMILDKKLYDNYVKILENELVPALGCTEPIAIAYAAAKAREILGEFPDHVEMRCSGNIIKNVKGVTVPNSDGQKGIDVAAILGIVGGDASRELEVLDSLRTWRRQENWRRQDIVHAHCRRMWRIFILWLKCVKTATMRR